MVFHGKNELARFAFPVAVLAVAAVLLGVRLTRLHVIPPAADAKKTPNYGFTHNTLGCRGAIYSANGYPLAQTKTVWTYHIDPVMAPTNPVRPNVPLTSQEILTKIKTVADLLQLPLLKVMDAYANRHSRYVYLATSDDDGAHATLTDPAQKMCELSVAEKQVRVYPQGRRLSHVLGFVSRDPTNAVGGAGVELKYEQLLKGNPGTVRGMRTATGGEVRIHRQLDVDAAPGHDVYLTIDHNVQYEVERILAEGLAAHRADKAWAVVLSVKTSAVLAMASLPDYDPDKFNKAPHDAMKNRAISENYEPGSVMKTITACAVINDGRVTPDTLIDTARNDPRYFRLPGDGSHKWDPFMSVRDALVHSSNIVYGKLGFDLGPERLYGYMTAFGLGSRTGIELPGEEGGLLPNWKAWDKVKWSRAPIGQGVAVTAIQLANAYAAIGNDGELLRPYIVRKIVNADGETVMPHPEKDVVGRPITPQTARKVREMMLGVAKKGGTARRAAVRGYTVAGKTGTAQMKEGRGYSQTAYNASFVGIVPATRPEIVILVTLQNPEYCRSFSKSQETGLPLYNHQGGVCAAPIFSKMASVILRYLEVEPDLPDEVPDDEDD